MAEYGDPNHQPPPNQPPGGPDPYGQDPYYRDYGGREDRTMPAVVYVLYLLGLFHGLTLIIGLVMAYVLRSSSGPVMAGHYTYLIRTFWTSFLVGLAGGAIMLVSIPFTFILIGIPFLWAGGVVCFLAWLWAIVRCVVGLVRLADGAPVRDPYGWAI
ncbi:MAG: DUF4870 family protein [Phenylobacterium sp.]